MANNTNHLNNVFGALSDPTRRAIVMRLCAGEASVGALAKPFDMALPSLMKHLRILESCGLIETEKIGRVRTCALHTASLETIEAWLAAQREIWERRLDRLEVYVEKLKKEEKSHVGKGNGSNSPLSTWALDREIVLSRVINARRELVFAAWSDPHHLPQWFGPAGFKVETKEIDIRVGGTWRFDMIAPDGKRYTNRMAFRRIEAPSLIEIDHGADKDNDPGIFRTTITFDEQSDGKTVITMRQLHPTKAQRDAGIGFGAVEFGYQTLDKLARHAETVMVS